MTHFKPHLQPHPLPRYYFNLHKQSFLYSSLSCKVCFDAFDALSCDRQIDTLLYNVVKLESLTLIFVTDVPKA